MLQAVECPFCGETHEVPIGEPESVFAGLPIASCPRIPEGMLYSDTQHETGPRGSLLVIPADR
jgi:hypothetical protein